MGTKLIIIILTLLAQPAAAQVDWLRALRGAMKAGTAYTMTDKELAAEAKKQVAQMDKQATVAGANSKYAKRLRRLTTGLKDADGITLNFKVYITKETNAFACPDGSVRVYSALMDLLNDNELLGVLGHEIGHVALRHSLKTWKDALYRGAVSDAIGSVSDTYASISDSRVGGIGALMISAKHSRYHETQADDYGYDFLKRSGRNPWAMAIAFEKIKRLSEGTTSKRLSSWLSAFSSHPDFDTRISRMSEKAKADGFKRP